MKEVLLSGALWIVTILAVMWIVALGIKHQRRRDIVQRLAANLTDPKESRQIVDPPEGMDTNVYINIDDLEPGTALDYATMIAVGWELDSCSIGGFQHDYTVNFRWSKPLENQGARSLGYVPRPSTNLSEAIGLWKEAGGGVIVGEGDMWQVNSLKMDTMEKMFTCDELEVALCKQIIHDRVRGDGVYIPYVFTLQGKAAYEHYQNVLEWKRQKGLDL